MQGYKTKTPGKVMEQIRPRWGIATRSMISSAFGGIIRTLADKVYTPIAVDGIAIVNYAYGRQVNDPYRFETSVS